MLRESQDRSLQKSVCIRIAKTISDRSLLATSLNTYVIKKGSLFDNAIMNGQFLGLFSKDCGPWGWGNFDLQKLF